MNKLPRWIFTAAIMQLICILFSGCAMLGIGDDDDDFECPSAYKQDVRNYLKIAENAFKAHGHNYSWDGKLKVKVMNKGLSGEALKKGTDGNGVAFHEATGQWCGGYTTSIDTTTYFVFAGTRIPSARMLHESARDILYDNKIFTDHYKIMHECGLWGSQKVY